jgi:hypothetical protein
MIRRNEEMRYRKIGLVVLILLLGFEKGSGETLTLDPSNGIIQGAPGQTVGWGYQFVNLGSYYDVLTESVFFPASVLGTYTDYISAPANFIVVDPVSAVSEAFNPYLTSGIGAFSIAPDAQAGDVLGDATIKLYYDVYSVSPDSPSFDPDTDLVTSGAQLQVAAELDVVENPVTIPGSPSTIPEPRYFVLVGGAFVLLIFAKRHA